MRYVGTPRSRHREALSGEGGGGCSYLSRTGGHNI